MFCETSAESSVGVLVKVLSIVPSRNHAESVFSCVILWEHLTTLHEPGFYEEFHVCPLESIIKHYFVCPAFLHTIGGVFLSVAILRSTTSTSLCRKCNFVYQLSSKKSYSEGNWYTYSCLHTNVIADTRLFLCVSYNHTGSGPISNTPCLRLINPCVCRGCWKVSIKQKRRPVRFSLCNDTILHQPDLTRDVALDPRISNA